MTATAMPRSEKSVLVLTRKLFGPNLISSFCMRRHEDMNGSAVALGILLAATQTKLRVNLDCWMAIAQNNLSSRAYKQNEVVTALNGTTLEIVHTDAEGRMLLADALTFAARAGPTSSWISRR